MYFGMDHLRNRRLVVIAKEEIDIGDFLDVSIAPENVYPTFEESACTEDAHARADRTESLVLRCEKM